MAGITEPLIWPSVNKKKTPSPASGWLCTFASLSNFAKATLESFVIWFLAEVCVNVCSCRRREQQVLGMGRLMMVA